jgi:hypothetical protein
MNAHRYIPPADSARATRDYAAVTFEPAPVSDHRRAQHIITIACIMIAAFSASYFAVRMLGAVL